CRRQPGRRVAGNAGRRPGAQRVGEGLLGEVLGEREIADVVGHGGDDSCPLDPPRRLDGPLRRCGTSPVGRGRLGSTDRLGGGGVQSRLVFSLPWSIHSCSFWIHSLSCGKSSTSLMRRISNWEPGPSGARLAHSIASSRVETSRIQKPLKSSRSSPEGPSVPTGSSSEKSTTDPS